MTFPLVLDILVAVLLVVTIGYAVLLNRRLGGLRRNKAELEKLAASFGDATTRAGDGIAKLKGAADDLQDRMDKAVALRDDLVFLIDRGGSSADRLEAMVRAARQADGGALKAAGPAPAKPSHGDAGEARRPSKAERDLLNALQSAR